MKKWLKISFVSLFVIVIALSSILFYVSYRRYEEAKQEMPVEDIREYLMTSIDNYVEYEDISPFLLEATYAVEDRRFYIREGIDFIALGRAIVKNISSMSLIEGGSTITQQLAKIVYFNYETSIERKVAELFFIYDFEDCYSKNEIIEMYVNVINYGDGNIGIYEASLNYFGKEPTELDLYESSLLAAIPNSPGNYQLSNDNPNTYKRQTKVLNDMQSLGLISQNEIDECLLRQPQLEVEE